jgi:SAM-dependent methyltransferase
MDLPSGVNMAGLDRATSKRLLKEARSAGPDEDPISEWYEGEISRKVGRTTGQVYTPPSIAFLMARLALETLGRTKRDLRVLDPACGCGTFLRALGLALGDGRRRLELVALEPVPRAAALAALNLEALGMEKGSVLEQDFFEHDGANMDLVIGNPPYIRQELLDGRSKGSVLARRSDLYAYFIERSARTLREGGLLGFIVPDKWMDVGYGVSLKRFMMENFRMRYVFSFDSNVFERAEVDTVIVLFERCSDPARRDSTMVAMVRLKGTMEVDDIIGATAGRGTTGSALEKVEVRQGSLEPRARWSHLLKAPAVFKELMASDRTVRLSEMGGVTIKRGVTTNLTRFFFPSNDDVERLQVPERFLVPAVRSPKKVKGLVLKEAPDLLLAIPEVLSKKDKRELAPVLRWGDSEVWGKGRCRVKELPSFRRKAGPWYSVRVGGPAQVLVPKFVRRGRPRFVLNRAGAQVSDTFQMISLDRWRALDRDVLLGCLNSVLGALSCELVGRVEGRGLLQLMTYELGNVLVLDVRRLEKEEKEAIASGFWELVDGKGPAPLDKAVIRVLGRGRMGKDIGRALSSLTEGRLSKEETGPLVMKGS